jgi:serine/threonine protein kinase
MDRERSRRIDELLQQALELEGEARTGFLDQVCGDDAELRREIEGMLDGEFDTGEFLKNSPALDSRPQDWADALQPGDRISHYIIESRIGRRGMGEVYLARDEKLLWKVAIKVLPPEFSTDPDRVRRFEQEALAASALNHPNIITIHEIGQSGRINFIATEYVDGQTLRERLSGERLAITAALEIAVQIASALDAAHQVGIVHRDIKPENIMLRRDGYIKVVDFGLAKMRHGNERVAERLEGETVESQGRELVDDLPLQSADPTLRSIAVSSLTNPGAVMGTLRYMSPEQARGLEVDNRSDLFNLGIVLYEMTAGFAPFGGATNVEVLASILERDPPALRKLSAEAPADLELVLDRAFRKEKADRDQSAGEMLQDLKRLKQEIDLKSIADGALPETETPARGVAFAGSAARSGIQNARSVFFVLAAIVIAIAGIVA